ncbi:MAG: MFS transporter [Candidatus Micrarchaeota archaeon]
MASKEKDLKNSIRDGAFYSIAAGAGEAYLAAYAVLRGASEAFIGSLSSLPALLGAFIQIAAPYAANRYRNRKKMVLFAVSLNAVSWLLMLSTVFLSVEIALPLLLVFFTVYVVSNAFTNPLWSGWMAEIVPEKIRGSFIGRRNSVTQLVALSATLAAGSLLGLFQDAALLVAFAGLFFVSFLARSISLYYLTRISDDDAKSPVFVENPLDFIKNPVNAETRNLVLYSCLFLVTVHLAAPFFVVYEFRDLGFTYFEFTVLLLAAGIARVVAMRYWGGLSQSFGSKTILFSCTVFASLIPLLWLTTTNFYVLALFEVFSGFTWAGIEFALFTYVLSSASQDRVPALISNYNFFAGVARFAGASLGIILLLFFNDHALFGLIGIPALFLVSGAARLAVSFLMSYSLRDLPLLVPLGRHPLLIKINSLHPSRDLFHSRHLIMHTGSDVASKTIDKGARIIRKGRRRVDMMRHKNGL